MKIQKQIYESIIETVPNPPPEIGVILGEKNGIICEVYFDFQNKTNQYIYCPDTESINSIISKWADDNISFCGIAHSHPRGQEELSSNDKEYIEQIMKAFYRQRKELFFPIIIAGKRMFGYIAKYQNSRVQILKNEFEIV